MVSAIESVNCFDLNSACGSIIDALNDIFVAADIVDAVIKAKYEMLLYRVRRKTIFLIQYCVRFSAIGQCFSERCLRWG